MLISPEYFLIEDEFTPIAIPQTKIKLRDRNNVIHNVIVDADSTTDTKNQEQGEWKTISRKLVDGWIYSEFHDTDQTIRKTQINKQYST